MHISMGQLTAKIIKLGIKARGFSKGQKKAN